MERGIKSQHMIDQINGFLRLLFMRSTIAYVLPSRETANNRADVDFRAATIFEAQIQK